MISTEARRVIRVLLDSDLYERRLAFGRTLARIKQSVPGGVSHSSRGLLQVTEACRQELIARVALTWQITQRVLSEVGVDIGGQLEEELSALIDATIDEQGSELLDTLTEIGGGRAPSTMPQAILNERDNLKQRYGAEVQLLTLRLRQSPAAAAGSQTVNNFYAPVGAYVAGAGASAQVTQTIDTQTAATLAAALDTLQQSLSGATDVDAAASEDVTSVIQELRTEIQQDKPRATRVRTLAAGLATTVQTLGSLRGAYEVLKAALVPLGIMLP